MALLLLKKRKLDLSHVQTDDEEDRSLNQLHVVTPRQHERLRMRQILDFSSEARLVCSASAPFQVVFANKAWSTLTSYGAHELMGKSVCEVVVNRCSGESSKKHRFILKMLQEAQQHTVSSCLHSYYGSTKDSQHFKSSLVVRPVFSTDLYGFEVLSHYLICMFDYVGKPSTEKEVVFDVQYVDVDHRRESPVAKAMRRNASFGALSDLTEHEYASLHCSSDASISKQLVSRSNSFHEENTQQYLKPSSVVVGKERVDQESIALTLLALKNHNDSLESNKVFP